MKEATGELNTTVVVILLVAFLSSFFFGVLWPNIRGNFSANTKCDEAICEKAPRSDGKTVNCTYKEKDGSTTNIVCTWKG